MRPFFICLLVLLADLPGSGFRPRPAGGFRPADIQALVLLPPIGIVTSIGAGNRVVFDPNASADAGEMLRQAIYQHDEQLHLKGQPVPEDSAAQRSTAVRIARTIGRLESHRKATLTQPQPWLDTLLMARHERYGLVGGVWGFTRTPANRRATMVRDLGIGLLSMGTMVPLTPSASTRLSVFIYDAQAHRIVYHKTNFPVEKDPLSGFGKVIDDELFGLLAKDFDLTRN